MPAPTSYARVLALLERLSPVWPSTATDKLVGKELGVIATALGHAADVLDTLLDETFPDTTDQLITRWEKVCRVPSRPADSLAVRRARVLAVLRRTSGPRLEQLGKMLEGPFDLDENDIVFVETTRQMIEEAIRYEFTVPFTLAVGTHNLLAARPWPGLVDSFGVQLTIASNGDNFTVTITSPSGTSWPLFGGDSLSVWGYDGSEMSYRNAVDFEGEPAGGTWTITIVRAGSSLDIETLQLLVSNTIDSAQIYRFFALRDYSLAGSPDITEGERLFRRTALGHMESHAIWRLEAVCDDDYTRCDREPCGE